ncbi:MAG: glycosyltransferase family 25 protein [Saprospiraceae bacterium]|nr:glycosyltransferase family 25 protein [Saprospiraceae bacterium]
MSKRRRNAKNTYAPPNELACCSPDTGFMTDGDMDTISHEEHQRLFSGELSVMSPAVSCAYKHISCYRDMLLQDIPFALIFEDDIFLESFFCDELQFILREIEEKKYKNFIVSLEDSSLTYVKGSERKPDTRLYPATKGRMAGAYFLDRVPAKSWWKQWNKTPATCRLTGFTTIVPIKVFYKCFGHIRHWPPKAASTELWVR